MKYTLISVGALLVAVIAAILIVYFFNKFKKCKRWINVLSSLILVGIFSISFTLIYFAFNYKATNHAKTYLKSDEIIEIKENKSYFKLDNINHDEKAIIFYGGGKVEEASYAPLCNKIAHQGIDVYLCKFPLYFPLINIGRASEIIKNNQYEHLYMMGHSLGGTAASLYLKDTKTTFDGIIFLASYSTTKLNDSLKCLSIYGSNDSVLNKEEYKKNTSNFPTNYKEVIIEGGNHSNFGDYGLQRKDTASKLSSDEQTTLTTSLVVSLFNS